MGLSTTPRQALHPGNCWPTQNRIHVVWGKSGALVSFCFLLLGFFFVFILFYFVFDRKKEPSRVDREVKRIWESVRGGERHDFV